jgi:hypothetical protein
MGSLRGSAQFSLEQANGCGNDIRLQVFDQAEAMRISTPQLQREETVSPRTGYAGQKCAASAACIVEVIRASSTEGRV